MTGHRSTPLACRLGSHVWETGTLSSGERVKRCARCQRKENICPAHPFGPESAVFSPEWIDRCTCPVVDATFTPDDKIGVGR